MIDVAALADWVRKQHAKGKHAMILVDGYTPDDLIASLALEFPGSQKLGTVDLVVNELWISARPVLSRIPHTMRATKSMGLCVVSESK